jgi:uncharacterized spore protein YtfJ
VYNSINTEHIRKILRLDGNLKDTIYDVITDNISVIKKYIKKNETNKKTITKIENASDEALKLYVYTDIINKIHLELPRPNIEDNTKLEDQFNTFKDKINDVIDIIFDEDALPDEIIGDFSDKIDNLKKLIKTIIIKRWLIDNDYMSEVTNMFTLNNDGIPMMDILDEYSSYVEGIEKTILPFIKKMNTYKEKLNDKLEKAENTEEEEPENTEEEEPENTEEEEPEDNNSVDSTTSDIDDDNDSSDDTTSDDENSSEEKSEEDQ